MDEKYISPEETEREKKRLIDEFKKHIGIHAFLDLTSFIKERSKIHDNHTHSGFVRSVAYKLEMTGDYEVIHSEDYTQFSIKKLPPKTLEERYPTFFKIGLIVIGAIISLASVLLQNQLKRPEAPPTYKLEDSRTGALYDSVAILRNEINSILADSTKTK